ncbi:hypothetical protein L484_000149 [Morus notabilis]|uniref:Uncharacterized protein n=1 Tax=Morus notabilis TaxID=981085 RepID=W9SN34_9ROSA|nr:uncharacterized protein LOC21383793 [Morus notabilis]EXC67511.1 hypothetical protein L484_000149 [Morus notabilis]
MSGVMPSLSPQAPLVGNVSRVATEVSSPIVRASSPAESLLRRGRYKMLARKSVKADVRLCRSRNQSEEEDVKEEAETVLDESEEEAPEVREHAPKDQNTSSTKKRAPSSTKIAGPSLDGGSEREENTSPGLEIHAGVTMEQVDKAVGRISMEEGLTPLRRS